MTNYKFIVNPAASRGKCRQRAEEVKIFCIGVFSGKHIHLPQVTMDRSNHVKVESEQGFAAHVDGELLSLNLKSLDVKLVPKAIEVVVS